MASAEPHIHSVQIYYEDTDHSGVVYHANYLKYFERAREHVLGPQALVRLLEDEGIGFAVYKATVTYRRGVGFGETVEVRTLVHKKSDYRLEFRQDIYYPGGDELLVEGLIDLVCLDADKQLVPLPDSVVEALEASERLAP